MASQKHQFEQQPPHKNTFTRAKHSRIGVTAPGWNTEIRKDALKRVVKTVSHYPHHPSLKPMKPSMERDSLLMWEEDWSEGPALPWTPEPDPHHRQEVLINLDSWPAPIAGHLPQTQIPGPCHWSLVTILPLKTQDPCQPWWMQPPSLPTFWPGTSNQLKK